MSRDARASKWISHVEGPAHDVPAAMDAAANNLSRAFCPAAFAPWHKI
jgi:hypothetical protein